MKILWISSLFPYPPNNGFKVRVFNLIKPLSKRHEITLISFIDPKENQRNISLLGKYCHKIRTVPFPQPKIKYSLFNSLPRAVCGYTSDQMQQTINEETKKTTFDVMIIEHLVMAKYLPPFFQGLSVLSLHDVESLRYKSTSKRKKGIKKKLWIIAETWKLYKYEINVTKKFDLCITVSEKDKKILQRWSPNGHFIEVPIGIDLSQFKPLPTPENDGKIITFCGALDYRPNTEAVLYFYRKIFPLIRSKIPKVTFLVVGRRPPMEIENLSLDRNVIVTGTVDDIKPFLMQSSVFVSPILSGGGSKVKIIQAMACGLLVISTTKGYEGINAIPGKELLVADKPAEFANHVVSLLQDRDLKNEISKRGRARIVRDYDMKAIANNLYLILRHEISRR